MSLPTLREIVEAEEAERFPAVVVPPIHDPVSLSRYTDSKSDTTDSSPSVGRPPQARALITKLTVEKAAAIQETNKPRQELSKEGENQCVEENVNTHHSFNTLPAVVVPPIDALVSLVPYTDSESDTTDSSSSSNSTDSSPPIGRPPQARALITKLTEEKAATIQETNILCQELSKEGENQCGMEDNVDEHQNINTLPAVVVSLE